MEYTVPCFILDDDADDIESMKEAFDKAGDIDSHFFMNPKEYLSIVDENSWVTVIDFRLPKTTGQEVLDEFLRRNPEGHAILISGVITPALSVRLANAGAKDCIEKKDNWEEWLAISVKKHVALVQDKIRLREEKKREHKEIKKLIGR